MIELSLIEFEMFVLTHTKKDGMLVDNCSKQIMVMKYLNFIYLYFNHSYILNFCTSLTIIFVFCNVRINLSNYYPNMKGCLLLFLLLLLLLHHL